MTAIRLPSRAVERVWGRTDLPDWTGAQDSVSPIGELWFEGRGDADPDLLVKYLFTAERLSIQVHPDDSAARALGLARGKSEAWFVTDAAPGAVIGLGLREPTSPGRLRAAAIDGSIEDMIDWRPVRAGDFIYSPAGTVHAIGAGLTVVEVQQNLDLTYRLYDYGRPRELHLDEGIGVADAGPWEAGFAPREIGPGRQLLLAGGAFVVERWSGGAADRIRTGGTEVLLIPLADGGRLDGVPVTRGSVWRVAGGAVLKGGPDFLCAYPGSEPLNDLLS